MKILSQHHVARCMCALAKSINSYFWKKARGIGLMLYFSNKKKEKYLMVPRWKFKKKEKKPLYFSGVSFMWKEHLTSHIAQLLVHVCFHHLWCNHYLLVQGCQLRRAERILASWRGALLETQQEHFFRALQTATVESGRVVAKPVRFSHCSTWHMVLPAKHLALTLKVVFGNSFKVDQSMKAQ